jgi:ribulose 1,5-bisphosphate synthetase/thiazole synthase
MHISRRNFIGTTTAAGSLAAAQQRTRRPGTPSQRTFVRMDRTELPVILRADVVVAGGSLSGVAAALELAKAGHKVALVEPRTYLGREIGGHLRPWLPADREVPPLLQPAAKAPANGGERPLHMDAVKLALEDALLAAGIEILYQSFPIGLCAAGLVIGNKSGRQVAACNLIVDATETSVVATMAGAEFEPFKSAPITFRRTVEFDNVGALEGTAISVPAALGIAGNSVAIHRSYRGPEVVQIEAALSLPVQAFDLWDGMRREIEARRRTMALAAHLIQNHPAFGQAYLAHSSYELAGPAATALRGQDGATPVRGVWAIVPTIDPMEALVRGQAMGERLARSWDTSHTREFAVPAADERAIAPGIEAAEMAVPRRGRRYQMAPVRPSFAPVLRDVDCLVAGGGTSGATATAVAAREKLRTVALEMNPGLGGTGTIAGVDSYWFGRQVGFCERLKQRVQQVHDSLRYKPPANQRPQKWNIEAKMFALLDDADKAGADVAFRTTAIATLVERGNKVRGVVAASSYGAFAVLSKIVLDCTGDGDVAAFAGAQANKMSTMDHLGMWYNFAQFAKPGRNANHFTSSLDVTDVEDCTRAVLAGRRRGVNCHDHGVYLAARETRHVLGDVTVTLTDIMRMRAWPDTANIHFSNSDMKGKTTSPWFLSGLVPPNFETEIPYRALLPKGLDNVLIAGKAFSATHDSLAGIREQPDLENLGGVVAIAAAIAIGREVSPRYIDVAELQRRLVKEGVLPETILTRKLKPSGYRDAEMPGLIRAMLQDQPLLAYQEVGFDDVQRQKIPFVEVCTAGPRIVPLLEAAMASTPRKLLVAQALAIHGSRAAVPVLAEAIEKAMAAGALPVRTANARWAQLPPDQGAMPDSAYYLYALGMIRDPRALPVWDKIASLFDAGLDDFRDRLRTPWHWVDGVCFGAERLGDPAAIAALQKLHAHPLLHGQSVKSGFQTDFVIERVAMLELGLGKALARCGSPAGYRILIEYLDDNRAALAEQAQSNLIRLAGRDCGKVRSEWEEWLSANLSTLRPAALTEDLDITYERDILINA